MTLTGADIVGGLVEVLGLALVAYLGAVKETRAVAVGCGAAPALERGDDPITDGVPSGGATGWGGQGRSWCRHGFRG